MGALIRQLNMAEQEIVVDMWREEASLLRSELEQAELRGVRLYGLLTVAMLLLPLTRYGRHSEKFAAGGWTEVLICD